MSEERKSWLRAAPNSTYQGPDRRLLHVKVDPCKFLLNFVRLTACLSALSRRLFAQHGN